MFLAVQAFRTLEEWRGVRVVHDDLWISGVHIWNPAAPDVQRKLYWFREMHYGGMPFGPYVNRNHFAGFAELFIPLALVPLMLGKVRRERWFIVGLFAVVSIGSLFLAASRGGIISFVVQVAIIVVWMSVRRTGRKQVLAGAAVLSGGAVDGVVAGGKRDCPAVFDDEDHGGGHREARFDAARHLADFYGSSVDGNGAGHVGGGLSAVRTDYDGRIVNHAHNDYLEALSETGDSGWIVLRVVSRECCCSIREGIIGEPSFACARC